MALHDTRAKRERQANKELAVKLALERQLTIKMRRYFNDMASRLQNLYAETGVILDTSEFNEQLNGILFEHYNKTSDAFKGNVLNHDDVHESIKEDQETLDRVDLAIAHSNIFNIGRSVSAINRTNQKKANSSLTNSIIAATVGGLILSRRQVARRAAIDFRRTGFARVNTISATETQKPAESTKNIELNAVDDKKTQKTVLVKTWNAVLDEKTRGSHADADGQTVEASDVYTVQGQSLNFPGDDSLGASADNIINCRCASVPHSDTKIIK